MKSVVLCTGSTRRSAGSSESPASSDGGPEAYSHRRGSLLAAGDDYRPSLTSTVAAVESSSSGDPRPAPASRRSADYGQ